MMEVVVPTAAIRRAKLQSNRHHQQINTQLHTGRMPFLSSKQQCQSTEGKFITRVDLTNLAMTNVDYCNKNLVRACGSKSIMMP